MKKHKILLPLALLVISALSAFLAATASAEETLIALWLSEGVIEVDLAVLMDGQFLFEDVKAGLGILCDAVLHGTVGNEGRGEITQVFDLMNNPLSLSHLLVCVNEKGCSGTPEISPEGLSWKTQLFLMSDGKILDLAEGVGFTARCTVLGISVEDTCTAADSEFEVFNDPEDAAIPENPATPAGDCTVGGTRSGINQPDELISILLKSGLLLTVSSE